MTLLAEVVIFVVLREPDVGLQHLQHMIVDRADQPHDQSHLQFWPPACQSRVRRSRLC